MELTEGKGSGQWEKKDPVVERAMFTSPIFFLGWNAFVLKGRGEAWTNFQQRTVYPQKIVYENLLHSQCVVGNSLLRGDDRWVGEMAGMPRRDFVENFGVSQFSHFERGFRER